MRWVFWISVVLIAYTYAGYPLWLFLRRRWRLRPVNSAPHFPSVSIVLAVHNEAGVLRQKLKNLTELDYPPDKVEIIAVSDGSTDQSDQILAAAPTDRIRTVLLPRREGKAAALNHGVRISKGDIIAFTDARQILATDALRHLVANFADPNVGAVTGELMLGQPEQARELSDGVGAYWKFEKKIRQWEGTTGSVIGVTGALYAVRRDLVPTLPHGTILDDVYIPLEVVRRGFRVIFEPRAIAWDLPSAGARQEFRRKVRTLTGNYQLLQLSPWLWTRANPVRFEFFSHKLLRLLVPFALASLLVSSLALEGSFYRLAGAIQLLFYGSAVFAAFQFRLGWLTRPANLALAFLMLNTAAVVALVTFAAGKREKVWVR